MNLKEQVEAAVPDFFDLEVQHEQQDHDGRTIDVITVHAENGEDVFEFDMAFTARDNLDGFKQQELIMGLTNLTEAAANNHTPYGSLDEEEREELESDDEEEESEDGSEEE